MALRYAKLILVHIYRFNIYVKFLLVKTYSKCTSKASKRMNALKRVKYRVYKKKLNRYEFALNFAKQLLVSGFLCI